MNFSASGAKMRMGGGAMTDGNNEWEKRAESVGALARKFVVPPFSLLDTRAADWQARKNVWRGVLGDLRNGREDGLCFNVGLSEKLGCRTSTSQFDPVLAEVLQVWFCPHGGKVIDPFAGGTVRGAVSAFLGNFYTGVDLRSEQVESNRAEFGAFAHLKNFDGGELARPNWICGDSARIDELVPEKDFDFMLTCPPYADLEVYSDDPKDLSTMNYEDFRNAYFGIIAKTAAKLKENALSAIVVGEVRSGRGVYRGFVPDTIAAFREAGMAYYNEIILAQMLGTLPVRVSSFFGGSRKVGKTHQNVLVFLKGDVKKIAFGGYNGGLTTEAADDAAAEET